jgi:hypothetical protein
VVQGRLHFLPPLPEILLPLIRGREHRLYQANAAGPQPTVAATKKSVASPTKPRRRGGFRSSKVPLRPNRGRMCRPG